ncbi:MAG: protein translocase subunit SecD [Desulfobulbaceae bacterium]|nr:protein translocase subunit SecD [Desulfobulbaceae bacterium]
MNTTLKLKFGLLAILIIFSVLAVVPSFYPGAPTWWKKYLAPEGLKLGLDLQGGIHVVLRVDLDKAIENSLDLAASDLKEVLAERNITAVRMDSGDSTRIVFTLPNIGVLGTVQEVITGEFENLDISVDSEEGTFPKITLQLKKKEIENIRKNAVGQSLEIIRNRIDQFGVTEPVILRQGDDQIVVQLPGVKDPDRAMDLIGQTAQLEFKLVADEDAGINLNQLITQAIANGQWQWGENPRQLNLALQGQIPQDTEIYFERVVDNQTKTETRVPILLKTQVLMTGEMVKDAQVRIGGNFNEPYVSLDLTGRGGTIFGNVTEKNVGKRLAIVLDEVVRSAPVIREKILGGKAQISGSFTHEEASDLAIVLRVGALPAPVEIIQNMSIGASLGKDSINKGLMSGLFGTFLVIVFMLIYYRVSGMVAIYALGLNMIFLFAGLAMLTATLTLPGIAGIILTIGMAVDANVLIYERMREEFALGKSVKSGIDSGFDNAFSSIVDSQVTTLITALALFIFGTGPIKGFAVTLSLGIMFNLFTVLYCTRLVYDGLYSIRKLKELNFLEFIKKSDFDFMKIRKFTFGVSGVMVFIGLIAFVQILRGEANLGVDFAGGSMLQYKAEQPFTLNEIRPVFAKSGWENIDLQEVTDENRLIVKIKKSEETVGHLGEELTAILDSELGDKGFFLESQSEIGSSISEELRNKAIMAVTISLLGVLVYLALRFDLSFGVAAAAATFHDVLVVLGICWLLGLEFNLLITTALLTLAGYSLNDTVVVFDRIRENLHKKKEGDTLHSVINFSINQVLSRTVVTGLTTLLTLLSLFFFGGSIIHDFSFALIAGIIVGTFSSIFVASPILTFWPEKN